MPGKVNLVRVATKLLNYTERSISIGFQLTKMTMSKTFLTQMNPHRAAQLKQNFKLTLVLLSLKFQIVLKYLLFDLFVHLFDLCGPLIALNTKMRSIMNWSATSHITYEGKRKLLYKELDTFTIIKDFVSCITLQSVYC